MARPRTAIGTYGKLSVKEIEPGKHRARTRYRFSDGTSRQIERWGTSAAKALHALKTALTTVEQNYGGELLPSTTLRELGHRFLANKRELQRSEGTLETYGYAVNVHIVPSIGSLTVAEAKTERIQTFLTRIEANNGPGAAKNCRSALSGMMGIAVRNGAITHNPVRDVERIKHKAKKGSDAVPIEQIPDFLDKIRNDEYLKRQDTVELLEFMLASGWRVAEACALQAESIDFEKGTAEVEAISVRVKGQGMVRQPFPKTSKSRRTTNLPAQTMALLRRRIDRLGKFTNLVFPTVTMKLRDPGNAQRELRERRELIGYPKLSTHSLRKTVATILDREGLSATEIADYLGHKNPSMTQDVYMNTIKGGTKAGATLQKQLEGLI